MTELNYKIDQKVFKKYVTAMQLGILGAVSMIIYVFVVELLTGGQSDGLKFLKYLFFALSISFGLCRLNSGQDGIFRYLPRSTFYTAVVSFTAASVMVLSYWAFLPLANVNMATIQAPDASMANLMPLSEPIMLFLEVFAMSMIIGFALLIYGTENTHMNHS